MKEEEDLLTGALRHIGLALIAGGLLALSFAALSLLIPEATDAEILRSLLVGGGALFIGAVMVLLAWVKPSRAPETSRKQ